MTFPLTPILADFAVLPNGGPPPTVDFSNGPFVAPGGMEINLGLCFPSGGADGCMQWIADEFGPMYEVFTKLGYTDINDLANLSISSLDGSSIYVAIWVITFPTANIELWHVVSGVSTLLDTIPNLPIAINDVLGIRGAFGVITAYVNGLPVGSFNGVTLPALGYIGGGSYTV